MCSCGIVPQLLGLCRSFLCRETAVSGRNALHGLTSSYHGELPAPAEITLTVGEFAGKNVTAYSVPDKGEPVEEATAMVTEEGKLTFQTEHCSLWYITGNETAENNQNNSTSRTAIWVAVIAVVVAAGAFAAWYFLRKRQK